jgi:hypothetical protein
MNRIIAHPWVKWACNRSRSSQSSIEVSFRSVLELFECRLFFYTVFRRYLLATVYRGKPFRFWLDSYVQLQNFVFALNTWQTSCGLPSSSRAAGVFVSCQCLRSGFLE